MNISLTTFSNPTADNLTPQINDFNNEKVTYQLFDLETKLRSNGQVTAKQTLNNTLCLASGTKFVKRPNLNFNPSAQSKNKKQ
jgi:hypothetical protein